MADNSSVPVAVGNETFANKDIGGVKFPKHIPYDSAGAEIVPATQTTAAAILAKIIAAPATEAKQDTMITSLQLIDNLAALIGRAAAAASFSTVLSTEDKAALDLISTTIAAVGTDVTPQPTTSGGFAAPFLSLDLDETEEEVKGSAGQLYKLRITNFATSVRYVKLYNATAAGTTVGTTTPIDTIPVPAGSSTAPTVITESFGGIGLPFSTALCLAATTGLAHNDTGAPGASEVVVTAYFK